ncbi:MAG TPA: IS1 family transposase [Pyrinomonadaceae bacterium]|nr:IS1 family transposase [Pyrinomonadaceae bacterium]
MTCHNCKIEAKKFGKDRKGNQRYRCNQCRKTFQEMKENVLGNMRISLDKAEMCLRLMLEGMSIRSIQRITGLHQETILDLLVLAGQKAERIMNEKIKGVPVKDVEADEIWGFVKMKRNTCIRKGIGNPEVGDAFTFVGIERNTKLVLAWHLGQRDTVNTEAFTEKLNYATSGRFQMTTDGLATYPDAVSYSLGTRVDYAQLIKVYGKLDVEGERKYSPPEVVETITKYIIGHADPRRICTSIVERGNLSIRTSVRRLTRLTNAFSKKWENLYAMMSLYFCWYNFCRIHSSIRCTPAMESGITGHVWTLRELLAT